MATSKKTTAKKSTTKKSTSKTAEALRIEKRDSGVAILWFDIPGEPVNTLKEGFSKDFEEAFSALEADKAVKAVVFASGKKTGFVVGADIGMLETIDTAEAGELVSRRGQAAMNRLERFKKPVVAAIDGACLGGGLELALACHARIASDSKKTKLGLPEVQLGLLPGAGGTQRLPALIGVQASLDLMLTGKQVRAKKAKKLGLVDDICAPAILVDVAERKALSMLKESKKKTSGWGKVKELLDGDELQEMALAENPLGRMVLFDQARKKLREKTLGNYPAPERILDAVKAGLESGPKKGYEVEARGFGQLLMSPESKQLIGIFRATTAMKKDNGVDSDVEARNVTKVGMVGAGLMGAGIAYVTAAMAKKPVRLKDRDSKGILGGMKYIGGIVDGRVKRRRMKKFEAEYLMQQISPTTSYSGLKDAEVVIEAVFEDINLKHKILKDVEANGHPEVIFATNTSSLPITDIAEASAHPETVIGMHYFSPVHKMPLLEIIVTEQTADWVTATCVELGKKQGKTVIVVNDGVGFYTTRVLGPFCNEASYILSEGVPIEQIDGALKKFGFPVGPIKLADEVGIDVGAKIGKILVDAFGDRMAPPPGMEKIIADGRAGRKNGKGFYLYDGKKKGVDPTIYDVIGVKPNNTKMKDMDIAWRCTLTMVNEAARCLEEGILRSPRDGDIGAIFGIGFPPFRGGPFRFVDATGAKEIVKRLRALEKTHGARFAPAQILIDKAESGALFYTDESASTNPTEPKKKVAKKKTATKKATTKKATTKKRASARS